MTPSRCARLTRGHGALFVVLIVFGINVLWQQRRLGTRRVDRELDALSVTLANVMQEELNEQDALVTAATESTTTLTAPRRALAILDTQGQVLGARWSGLDLGGQLPRRDAASVQTLQTGGGAWRVHVRPQAFGNRTLVLLVASQMTDMLREQREARGDAGRHSDRCCWQPAAGCGWRRRLRPITDMRAAGGGIPPNGPRRISARSQCTDELGQLARRSTAWSRGCARRCKRSGSSWPTPRTSCGRRCRSSAPLLTSC